MAIESLGKYISICSLILLGGCMRAGTDLEKMLINNKWIYHPYGKVVKNVKFTSYRKFYKDNKCKDFDIDSNREILGFERKVDEITWNYSEEKEILNIAGYDFKVVRISKDTIYLHKSDDNSQPALIRYFGQELNKELIKQ